MIQPGCGGNLIGTEESMGANQLIEILRNKFIKNMSNKEKIMMKRNIIYKSNNIRLGERKGFYNTVGVR